MGPEGQTSAPGPGRLEAYMEAGGRGRGVGGDAGVGWARPLAGVGSGGC